MKIRWTDKSATKIIAGGCIGLMCVLAVLSGFSINADAAEIGFSVSTVIPDNQVDKGQTYFDLLMKPGQEQTLEVELRNGTAEEIEVEAVVHSATTNSNGVVEYGERDIDPDPSLRYNMSDLIELEEHITIPANATYVLQMDLTMPVEEYDGVLAGGITFSEVEKEEAQDETDDGIAIQNKYAYVVGVVLRENENAVEPDLDLDRVFANQINARNVISANIRNFMPMYMNNLEVEAEITGQGETEVLYSAARADMQMAPNSNFDFPVPLEGQKMRAGTYTINVIARSMGQEWTWSKDFTITDEEARVFNETDVEIEADDYTLYYIIAGIIILAVLIIAAVVIRSRRKAQQQRAEFEAVLKNSGFKGK